MKPATITSRLLGGAAAGLLALALVGPPSALRAQTPPAEPTYTLTVNATELNLLAAAIQEMPKKHADPLLAKFTAQIGEQAAARKAEQDAAAAKEKEAPASPAKK